MYDNRIFLPRCSKISPKLFHCSSNSSCVKGSIGCWPGSNVSVFCWRSISFIIFKPEIESGEILRFVSLFSVAISTDFCGSIDTTFGVDFTSTIGSR